MDPANFSVGGGSPVSLMQVGSPRSDCSNSSYVSTPISSVLRTDDIGKENISLNVLENRKMDLRVEITDIMSPSYGERGVDSRISSAEEVLRKLRPFDSPQALPRSAKRFAKGRSPDLSAIVHHAFQPIISDFLQGMSLKRMEEGLQIKILMNCQEERNWLGAIAKGFVMDLDSIEKQVKVYREKLCHEGGLSRRAIREDLLHYRRELLSEVLNDQRENSIPILNRVLDRYKKGLVETGKSLEEVDKLGKKKYASFYEKLNLSATGVSKPWKIYKDGLPVAVTKPFFKFRRGTICLPDQLRAGVKPFETLLNEFLVSNSIGRHQVFNSSGLRVIPSRLVYLPISLFIDDRKFLQAFSATPLVPCSIHPYIGASMDLAKLNVKIQAEVDLGFREKRASENGGALREFLNQRGLKEALQRAQIMDLLTHQIDRNEGNILYQNEGRRAILYLIDHSLSMPKGLGEQVRSSCFWESLEFDDLSEDVKIFLSSFDPVAEITRMLEIVPGIKKKKKKDFFLCMQSVKYCFDCRKNLKFLEKNLASISSSLDFMEYDQSYRERVVAILEREMKKSNEKEKKKSREEI